MAKLIMLPVPIAEAPIEDVLPQAVIEEARKLAYFLAENAKTTRAFLKKVNHPCPLSELSIVEIGHNPETSKIDEWLKPLQEGHDIAVVSEAGCPGVADPGAQIARRAMKLGFEVKPLVGPSSILLALMASGLDGQHFRFCGYLPIKDGERVTAIQRLEKRSSEGQGETQIFIETPYRCNTLLVFLKTICQPETLITVASDITGPQEFIKTQTAEEWKKSSITLPKLPAIFLLLAQKRTSSSGSRRRNGQ
ncbi:MAG: SAM-dependent methyltransferase [Burkholderiales bacterium]|nr:SAM-dependent methyltransferase [Burkholderiales bacterium]